MRIPSFSLPLIAGFSLLLGACSSDPAASSASADALTPRVDFITHLPITTTWKDWQCRDGSRISTRFQDADKRQLLVKSQGREYRLDHQPSSHPAIYENASIAFFSDGESAVIGRPQSDQVYQSGCKPL